MRFLKIMITLMVVLAGLLLLAVISYDVSGKTITVGKDGAGDYNKIQQAIDAAEEGDTIRIFTGIYKERIMVNKTLIIEGNGTSKTEIDGGEKSEIVNISAPGCDFSNILVTRVTYRTTWETWIGIKVVANNTKIHDTRSMNSSFGMSFEYCNNNIVTDNDCSDNEQGYGVGIHFDHSSGNTIRDNTCSNNANIGIYLKYHSDQNLVEDNTCSRNADGIHLKFSDNNTVRRNTCSIGQNGIYVQQSSFNRIENNTLHDNLYYDEFVVIIPRSVEGVAIGFIDSENNVFSNNECNKYLVGLYLYNSFHNTIQDNVFSTGEYGMYSVESRKNTISGNTLIENGQDKYGLDNDDGDDGGFLPGFGIIGMIVIFITVGGSKKRSDYPDN